MNVNTEGLECNTFHITPLERETRLLGLRTGFVAPHSETMRRRDWSALATIASKAGYRLIYFRETTDLEFEGAAGHDSDRRC